MIKRIHFKDQGQDFLYWDLKIIGSDDGVLAQVVDSQPFQADIWTNYFVLGPLKKGVKVSYSRDPDSEVRVLKYPITKVEVLEGASA